MTYVIVEPCIGTKNASCVDVCPVSCIYEAEDMYYINPDECIECGACEPECPVNAIFHDSAVPATGRSVRGFSVCSSATPQGRHCHGRWRSLGTLARTRRTRCTRPD